MTSSNQGAGRTQEPLCPFFCPGCHNRKLSPQERLDEKRRFVSQILSAWGDRIGPVREPAEENRKGYREKVCLAAEWGEGGWRIGLRHRQALIPIHHCPLHSSRVNTIIGLMAGVLPAAGSFPLAYYLQSGSQVTLVVKIRDLPDLSWLTAEVTGAFARAGGQGLWLHLHPAAGRRVTAKNTWHLVWGEPRSIDSTGLIYGPTAFQQLIPDLSRAALDEAESFLAPGADDGVLDLYCGIGGSLRRWAGRAGCVAGVEISAESVECAGINAPSATILRGAARQRLPQLAELLTVDPDHRLLYVNPPRTGIEPEVLDWIADVFRPKRIACLSCNAVSLNRDLSRLTAGGYEVEKIIPFDFFPETRYLEMLALLTRE
ncbi:MAG: class I SAM-dependent RNA methyltransferase [Thermodesulfobacteriota bacterium]